MDWKVNLFVCLCVSLLLDCCKGDATDTVYEVLQRTQGLSKFEELVRKANLVTFFQYPNTYTIFAPNDTAYDNLLPEKKAMVDNLSGVDLENFIRFHVIEQKLMTGDFLDNSERRSMSSAKLFLNRREGSSLSGWFGPPTFFVNGAMISNTQKDLVGINGVVHGLMIWIDETSTKTAYQYIQSPDDTSLKSINSSKFYTEVLDKLARSGQYYSPITDLSRYDAKLTLFVPNDEAINKIPGERLKELQQDVAKLYRVVKAHYIMDAVLFTTYVNHNQGFLNSNSKTLSMRKPYEYKVYVNSDGVTAAVTKGNITVNNGVLHICDTLLGYIYNTVRQQIVEESSKFDQYINKAPSAVRDILVASQGVNVFVPTSEAFDKFRHIPMYSLDTDLALLDKVIRLHILQPGQSIQVSSLVGEYESRQYRESYYNPGSYDKLSIYRQRNETWVQGATVMAKIIKADVGATNGRIQVIDTVLGIPYLDMTNLICSDLWLLRTYDFMRAVGMKDYLRDGRFFSAVCPFESKGYPPNYGINNIYSSNYVTIPPWTNTPAWDMGTCGSCQLTFFAPNSSAIDYFSNTDHGQKIMRNAYLLQNLFKRLLFHQRIELEKLSNANYHYRAANGDTVRVSKSSDRFVTLYYQRASARIIHMDNGATNGIVHIIDNFLYTPDDLTIGASTQIQCNILLLLFTMVYILYICL